VSHGVERVWKKSLKGKRRETVAKEPGVVRMRQQARSASTHRRDDQRRAWGYAGRGARIGVGVVVLLVVMALGAISASAGTPSLGKLAASGARVLPAETGTLGAEVGAPRRLAPFAPAVVPSASRASGVASGDTIFYDGFEQGGSNWGVQGDPTWGITTYRYFAGTHSAYCAGDGILPPGPYASNMDAWIFAGPFDLSDVTSATFDFELYLNSELGYDGLFYLVSTDGQNFYGPDGISGNTQGWIAESLDLTAVPTLGNVCGHSQVWIAFNFTSDASGTGEGAYVDQVNLTGSGGSGAVALSLQATSPLIVPFDGSVNLEGEIRDASSGALVPNQEVWLGYSQEDSQEGQWYRLGPYTSSTGEYSLGATNIQRLTYFALIFDPLGLNVWSPRPYVKVQAHAKLTAPKVPKRVRAGAVFTSWGTLKPVHTPEQNKQGHTKVTLDRKVNGNWRHIKTLTADMYKNTSSETKFGMELFFPPIVTLGQWRIQAVHEDGDHVKSISPWRTFTVR